MDAVIIGTTNLTANGLKNTTIYTNSPTNVFDAFIAGDSVYQQEFSIYCNNGDVCTIICETTAACDMMNLNCTDGNCTIDTPTTLSPRPTTSPTTLSTTTLSSTTSSSTTSSSATQLNDGDTDHGLLVGGAISLSVYCATCFGCILLLIDVD